MTASGGDDGRRRTAGFTLLEILAVVAIFALLSSFLLPNFGALRARALRREAQAMASHLELARQRSVMTGIPHRLWIDIESGGYRLEWLRSEQDLAGTPAPEPEPLDLRGSTPLPLEAPRAALAEYHPVPGRFGRMEYLEEDLRFAGVETPGGYLKRGDTFVSFDRDGTTVFTTIVLDDADGRQLELDVLPLADVVRIRDERG